jgi:methyl-accepting chemotaxis protein
MLHRSIDDIFIKILLMKREVYQENLLVKGANMFAITRIIDNLTISIKLLIVVFIVIIGLVVSSFLALTSARDRMLSERLSEVHAAVDMTVNLATHLDQQVQTGKLTQDQAQAQFREIVTAERFDNGDYVFAYTFDGVLFVNPGQPQNIGKNLIDLTDVYGHQITRQILTIAQSGQGGTASYWYPRAGSTVPIPKYAYVRGFMPWNIAIAAGVYVDDVDAAFWSMVWTLAEFLVPLFLVLCALVMLIRTSVAGGLKSLASAMRKLAEGDLSITIEGAKRRDEIGTMAAAVEVFRQNAEENHALRARQEEMKASAEREKRATLVKMADQFQATVGGVVQTVVTAVGHLETTAKAMAGSADQSTARSSVVASAANQATENVQTISAATEQLSASINEIGQQLNRSAGITKQAVDQSNTVNAKMRALAGAAQKIGAVVSLINDIASQTNLLALNATIEAARAGEAGKGFAVVASEVKALANQTAHATGEIAAQIQSIQSETDASVTGMGLIARTIDEIDGTVATIAAAVEQQGAATREIARNVEQAAVGTNEVSANINGVREATSETGSAAADVLSSAGVLAQQTAVLRDQVSGFIAEIRAA